MPADDIDVLQRLMAGLDEAGIAYRHTQHEPVYTSADAAAVRGTPLHSGAKALILKGKDEFVLAVIPADLALDGPATRRHLGSRRLRFASNEELLEMTGLAPGSIPPFGSLFGLATVCDERLSDNEMINFNAGSHTDSLQIRYEDYLRYERPDVARIARLPEDDS